MVIYDSRRQRFSLGDLLGRGGEANVYLLKDRPGWLAKIYTGQLRPHYPRKLAWMRAHPPDDPTLPQGHASLAWPVDLLSDERGRILGYIMPHIRNAVPLLEVFNPRRRAQVLPNFDWFYLHRAARNLATTLGALHARGYVVGDLNESNVLVTPAALITLIDTDSFQVRETENGRSVMTHRCPVAKLEYTPPELQGRSFERTLRLPEHDRFGLGVLIFQLLLDGSHPYRAQWLGSGDPPPVEERIRRGCFPYMTSPPCPVAPAAGAPGLDLLYPKVVDLVRRCFIAGTRNPKERPSPEMWEHALAEAEDSLKLCPNQHYFSGHFRRCPFCPEAPGWAQRGLPSLGFPFQPSASRPAPSRPQEAAAASPVAGAIVPVSGALIVAPPSVQPQMAGAGRGGEILEVLKAGGSVSGLAGFIFGALAAGIPLILGKPVSWPLVWAFGAAVGGIGRGWQLGQGVGRAVGGRFGWERAWQVIGALGGAAGALSFGLGLGWSVLLLAVLLAAGAFLGRFIGLLVWSLGERVGWVEIWMVAGALGGAWLGWVLGSTLGGTWIGDLSGAMAGDLAAWMVGRSLGQGFAWALVGAIGGAFGGALSGVSVELLAKLLGVR